MRHSRWKRETWPTLGEFNFWLVNGKGGTCYAYHYGLLALDRGPDEKRVSVVDDLAAAAWWAMVRNEVVLTQQRIGEPGDGKFVYLAIKR